MTPNTRPMSAPTEQLQDIAIDHVHLHGVLALPAQAQGLVIFAHGSGSSRHSPRNNYVARVLQAQGMATLLADLLTVAEDLDYQTRFDISLLTHRLLGLTRWAKLAPGTRDLPLGYFGASTGAAAALQAAAGLGGDIRAVVSRGGRPDLAGAHQLARVSAPTLLLVGSRDEEVLALNHEAYAHLHDPKQLSVIPGASHLFGEPGTLEEVARQASVWFGRYLKDLSTTSPNWAC
jgi:putative phosphoribosyl transferase